MEKQGSKSSFWPSQGLRRLQKWCFHLYQPMGWCGRWCLWPSSCPSPKPIYPHGRNAQYVMQIHNVGRVWSWAEGALGGISLRRKSISAREGRNVILITPEIKSFRRLNERCTYLWVFCLACMETFQKQMAKQRFISH